VIIEAAESRYPTYRTPPDHATTGGEMTQQR